MRILKVAPSGHSILHSNINGTDQQTLTDQLGFPEGIAIDWKARNVYFAGKSEQIR